MAGSVNKVILVGNLGRDPEVRRLNSGDPVCNLNVATTETWRDKGSGERQERTEWHRVVLFNENLVKVAENYLRKGSKVYIEGQLQTRKYTDQQGVEKYATEIVLQRFRGELQMLDSKDGGSAGQSDAPRSQDPHYNAAKDERRNVPEYDDLDGERIIYRVRQHARRGGREE